VFELERLAIEGRRGRMVETTYSARVTTARALHALAIARCSTCCAQTQLWEAVSSLTRKLELADDAGERAEPRDARRPASHT